jgi:hypothetical protein
MIASLQNCGITVKHRCGCVWDAAGTTGRMLLTAAYYKTIYVQPCTYNEGRSAAGAIDLSRFGWLQQQRAGAREGPLKN